MQFIQTAVAFIFALIVLVTIHELGHYLVARWCGVRILRFSVGIGKPLLIRKFGKSDTEWVLSALPLGGYVKMLDSREHDLSSSSAAEQAGDFSRKSVWQRIAIVAAGPFANFLLASVLFCALFSYGTPDPIAKLRIASETSTAFSAGLRQGDLVRTVNGGEVKSWSEMRWKILQIGLSKQDATLEISRNKPALGVGGNTLIVKLPLTHLKSVDFEADFLGILGLGFFRPPAFLKEVVPNGPADRAGLRAGDQILAIDGRLLLDSLEFVQIVNAAPNKSLSLLVSNKKGQFDVTITPESKSENGIEVGRIQVIPLADVETTIVSYSVLESFAKGVTKTWDTSVLTVKMLWKIVAGDVSWKNITGPITIADYAGQTARTSVFSYISFIALISISLGVMNLLPIPVLDGGHLLYYSLEVLTGKPIPDKYAEMAQRGGLVALLCLMVVAFFNDIVRLMS
jgi:regulator of sigma E protease